MLTIILIHVQRGRTLGTVLVFLYVFPYAFRIRREPQTRVGLVTSSLPRKRSTPELSRQNFKKKSQAALLVILGAEDEGRTRDIQLGRLTLYQLSYFRIFVSKIVGKRFANLNKILKPAKRFFIKCGESRIRTCEVVRQQSYSLIHLATLESPQYFTKNEPPEGLEPTTC